MTLWELIRRESSGEGRSLIASATLAGGANALGIALINAAATEGGEKVRSFILIALCVLLYIVCSRRTYHRTTAIIEQALKKIKLRVIDKIERADLQGIERLGTSEIYDRITENMSVVSDSAGITANFLQSLCILACASIYILSLSPPAFMLLMLLNGVGMMRYFARNTEIGEHLREVARKRVTFFDQITDMLKGVKEMRLSRRRAQDVRQDISVTTEELRSATVNANNLFNDNLILAQCVLFVLLITMVFVLPQHVSIDSVKVTTLVGAVLFFWSPLGGAVGGMPAYKRSNMALANIEALEEKLERAARGVVPPEKAEDPWKGEFSTIEMDDVRFAYATEADEHAFQIGPMNLSITRGEVVFVVGGNGSGKSTFMKVLMGLYPVTSGTLCLDGTQIRAENVASYREMFSVIFADFHLFSKLYGVLDADEQLVQRLLKQMQIADKTSYVDARFTTRSLSTGQRKRLAMIVSLLEDRPICVFDEWAADQDPEFRRYFYDELIPSLKARGKTVIAVTHDDRYFHYADRVVTLEYGQVKSIEEHATRSKAAPVG
ncbi:cyclic peptide export ABC transporter [Chondromyces apiculatus]|uniref:Putative ABC transporter ATP-binding protein n=1 Tax=Chondromyces apiculatus DSM 436 TaxID=1192034 RepID=A0A017T5P0_9BACT|nr:cyclic peptide export ABC transporter [Chondromyces apiculatus]EYF04563.1 putative ABC transporter ATP-binding protein [Chondromyces apiculatus DSM 436]